MCVTAAAGMLASTLHSAEASRTATVKGDRISVRKGPHENHRRLTLLDKGTRLKALRKAGDWFKVELASGTTGWVRQDFLKLGKSISGAGSKRTARRERNEKKPVRVAASKQKAVKQVRAAAKPLSAKRKLAAIIEKKRRAALIAKVKHERRTQRVQIARRQHEERLERKQRDQRIRAARARRMAQARRSRVEVSARPGSGGPDIVRTALAYRGVRYRFGGQSRSGFDCSGFTSHVLGGKGVRLPRTAREQFKVGQRVTSKELKPGDLVFFHTTRPGVSHVGMYAGSGKFVHASSGGGKVQVDSLTDGYYKKRLVGARRMK
jgi:cell wall-associated NlpC family hydrolase